jgi:rhamnogalacturonan acetylesterase
LTVFESSVLTRPISLAATQMGGPQAGVYFVAHEAYAAQAMKNLGSAKVNAGYPNDHTHTSPYMADVMSQSFVLGLKCGTSELGKKTLNSTASLTDGFLGACIATTASAPV